METIRTATGTQILNPHVPTFITKAPWYSDLKHVVGERKDTANDLNDWYERGKTVGQAATKYRKGACENCGAMTHKTRDCVERPRKVRILLLLNDLLIHIIHSIGRCQV